MSRLVTTVVYRWGWIAVSHWDYYTKNGLMVSQILSVWEELAIHLLVSEAELGSPSTLVDSWEHFEWRVAVVLDWKYNYLSGVGYSLVAICLYF